MQNELLGAIYPGDITGYETVDATGRSMTIPG
jgi:hypothetical protein